jgi:pyrimidine-nucleoside phosphorylase
MTPYKIIQHKQSGKENSQAEIEYMVNGAMSGLVQEAQIAAWFMAIYFKGMSIREIWDLTHAMWHSGEVFQLDDIAGYKADKHSTGGVGDKITFILAPMMAAAGLNVPSITGRGLGHTGGTLDKMDSVPGLKSGLSQEDLKRVLRDSGLSLIGQTENLVPADKLFYALRDVTATVESVPLICASILSKKFAEGIDGLILDVKCGSGAIFQELADARTLAESLVEIASKGGKDVGAIITDMESPLGRQIGNWNEMVESAECLKGWGSPDLMEVSLVLGSAALILSGKTKDLSEAYRLMLDTIKSGEASRRLMQMIELQGGSIDWFSNPHHATRPLYGMTIQPEKAGYIQSINSRILGLAAIDLGAGRRVKGEEIDHSAGITIHKHSHEFVKTNDPICDIYSSRIEDLQSIANTVRKAWTIADEPGMINNCISLDKGTQNYSSRIIEIIGLPFSAGEWRKQVEELGLGIVERPLSVVSLV